MYDVIMVMVMMMMMTVMMVMITDRGRPEARGYRLLCTMWWRNCVI